jgi:hypothetical protein
VHSVKPGNRGDQTEAKPAARRMAALLGAVEPSQDGVSLLRGVSRGRCQIQALGGHIMRSEDKKGRSRKRRDLCAAKCPTACFLLSPSLDDLDAEAAEVYAITPRLSGAAA